MKGLATYLCEKIGPIEDTELKIQECQISTEQRVLVKSDKHLARSKL